MTGPNVGEGGYEGIERGQKTEKDLYNELITGFSGSYIQSLESSEKNSLVKEVMTGDIIVGTDIEKYLKKYIAENDDFTGVDISKINIYQLKRKLSGAFATRKNNESLFKKQVLQDFQITGDEYDKNIQKTVGKLDDTKLSQGLKSESERNTFLTSLLSNLPDKREQLSILSSISEIESGKRIAKLSPDDRTQVLGVLEKVAQRGLLDDTDIKILINSGYLGSSEIKKLVEAFIPHMSLEKAREIGLITADAAGAIRDRYIKDYTKEHGINLDAATENEIQTSLSLSDILIDAQTLKPSDADYKKIANEIGFRDLERDLQKHHEEIEEQIKISGPQSFGDLQSGILGLQNPNLVGFEKFGEKSILEFKTIHEGEAVSNFVKIVSIDENDKKFGFKKLGQDVVNLSAGGDISFKSFGGFYDALKAGKSSVRVYSDDEMKEKIQSGDIKTSDFQSYDSSDFTGVENTEKRSDIQEKAVAQLDREIEAVESELKTHPDSQFLKAQLEHKTNRREELQSSTMMPDEAARNATYFSLLEKLADLDSDGKGLGIEKGTFIETDSNAFEITGFDIDSETIVLKGIKPGSENIPFSDFIEAFKKQKAKRTRKLSTVGEFLGRVGDSLGWGSVEYSGGEIIQKGIEYKGQKPEQVITYLTGSETDTLVKICDITDGYVEIQRGEIKDTKKNKGKKNEQEVQELQIKGAEVERYTLNEFAKFLESEELKPNWKLGKTGLEVEPDSPHNPRNKGNTPGGMLWKTFVAGRISIAELMAGGKLIPELVEEYFKKGSDIKSAKAALAMGKFLPKQMRDELLVKVEKAEGESMETALENLGKIDSPIAVQRIEHWLLDKNTPEYNKEAGLIFMLSKYGHLTAKGAMYPYRGKWLWYEAFGGRVNDALFLKKKAEAAADDQVFSEEYLMHMLLKEQCAGRHYSGIKRRGRLHKEYENKWKSGVEEEFEKGYKDANNKRTASKMVEEGMGEALGGTTTNALGWMKKAVERGGSLEDMMEISFSLMFSGAMFDVDQATYLKAKGLWDGDGQPIVSQRMMSSVPEMQLFNKTVLELSKRVGEAYPQRFGGIADEAQKIFNNSQSNKRTEISEKERLTAANNFWKKYGEVLSRGLNISMQPDSEYSLTDTIIKREKDDNPVFSEYYNKVKGYTDEGSGVFKADFIEDASGDTGVFGLNTYKMAKKFLEVTQGGGCKKEIAGEKAWKRMHEDINSTPGKLLIIGAELDSPENRKAQKKYIATQLKEISAGLLAAHGGNQTALAALNNPTGFLGGQLNSWGVHIKDDLGIYTSDDIKKGENYSYFEQAAERIISGNTLGNTGDTPIELQTQATKDKVDAAAGQKKTDDADPRKFN